MATLIYRYEFIQNNPAGTFVAGDVLEIYVDEDAIVENTNPWFIETTGITAFKNDVEIFSGPFISTSPDIVSIEILNPKFCKDTFLVNFGGYVIWPYANYSTIPDSQECAVNPVSCDLIVVANPDVTSPSTEGAADGEITITATSSNAIEYKLNSDFFYGQGQSSGTFTGLTVGNYRIYVRDSKNCAANVYVELKFIGDYGAKYRLEYYDFTGAQTTLDICERSYAGAVSDYCGSDNPVEIQMRGEGESNKFLPLIPVQINLGIISETEQQYIDLYTNDPDKYRIKYYKDGNLKLVNKLLPFVYSEDYGAAPYQINVSGYDGLADLSNIYLVQDDGLRMYGEIKLIKLIALCLKYTRLGLDIRVACNMYALGMNSASYDDPLDQAYCDVEAFYLAEQNTTVGFVLESILKPFGARLVQWGGYWNIVRVEEMGASYDYREFDTNGDYVTNGTFNPVLDLDYPGLGDCHFTGIPNMELQNGYGKISVNYSLGAKSNFLDNGDFRLVSRYSPEVNRYFPVINIDGWVLNSPDQSISQTHEIIDDNNVALVLYANGTDITNIGTTYIKTKAYNLVMGPANQIIIKVRYKLFLGPADQLPYIKVRLKVQYGSLYLQGDGTWTSTATILSFFATQAGEYIESEIKASQPSSGTPLDGMDFYVSLYMAYPYYADYTTLADLRAVTTTTLPIGYKTEVRKLNNLAVPVLTMYYYELTETTEAESGDDIVEPGDYNVSTNPVKWILKQTGYINTTLTYPFAIDYVNCGFLTNGTEPAKNILKSVIGESRNKLQFEESLILGSSGINITTESGVFFDYSKLLWPSASMSWNSIITSVVSHELVYTGYLRNSSGTAWNLWTRDGFSESQSLHEIWLKMAAAQYSRTWRMLRASVISQTINVTPLNSFAEVNDSNRIYVPMSMTINDRKNIASCELVETGVKGLDDTASREHSSAFSSAHS